VLGVKPESDAECELVPVDVAETLPYEDVSPYAIDDEAASSVFHVIAAVDVAVDVAILLITGAVVSAGAATVNDRAVVVEVFPYVSVTLVNKLYEPYPNPLKVFLTEYVFVLHIDQ
jgi:hypothetical protein